MHDLLIGAPSSSNRTATNEDSAYVIYGKKGGYSSPLTIQELNQVNVTSFLGFRITGEGGNALGYSVSGGGNFNGESRAELLLDEPLSNYGVGTAHLIYGSRWNTFYNYTSPLSLRDNLKRWIEEERKDWSHIYGKYEDSRPVPLYKNSVKYIGDFNRDNINDIVVRSRFGTHHVIYGGHYGRPYQRDISLSKDAKGISIFGGQYKGLEISPVQTFERTPSSGSWRTYWNPSPGYAGDINGDGFEDLLIGVRDYNVPNPAYKGPDSSTFESRSPYEPGGAVLVLYGRRDLLTEPLSFDNFTCPLGFKIWGYPSMQEERIQESSFAEAVSGAGDFNGDGLQDLLMSDSVRTTAYVVYGKPSQCPPVDSTEETHSSEATNSSESSSPLSPVCSSASSLSSWYAPSWYAPTTWWSSVKSWWTSSPKPQREYTLADALADMEGCAQHPERRVDFFQFLDRCGGIDSSQKELFKSLVDSKIQLLHSSSLQALNGTERETLAFPYEERVFLPPFDSFSDFTLRTRRRTSPRAVSA